MHFKYERHDQAGDSRLQQDLGQTMTEQVMEAIICSGQYGHEEHGMGLAKVMPKMPKKLVQ